MKKFYTIDIINLPIPLLVTDISDYYPQPA